MFSYTSKYKDEKSKPGWSEHIGYGTRSYGIG